MVLLETLKTLTPHPVTFPKLLTCGGWLARIQDQSLRLWNLRTHVCALVATGDGSHRNEVLSIVRSPALSPSFSKHKWGLVCSIGC